MFTPITGMPGIGTVVTATPREIFAGNAQFNQYIPGFFIIDGIKAADPLNVDAVTAATQYDVLRCGLLMGKITASGKYGASVIGVTTGAITTSSTTIAVSAAVGTEIVRRIGASGTFKLTGPPTAAGVVATQTVTYSAISGTAVTVTALGTNGAAVVAGSLIQPTDGSETILTMIGDKYGIKVSDLSANRQDTPADQFTLGGFVNSSNIINYPADASLKTWVKAALNAAGSYQFSDAF